jgi:hypothetical protein
VAAPLMPGDPGYYGPGHPEFDRKFRERWLADMRRLLDEKIPDLTDEKFNEFIAEMDKIRDEFVASLNKDARPNTSAEEA